MDTRFAVFIVHGIETQGKQFSHAMQENLRSNFKKALRHMGQENREGQDDALIFREDSGQTSPRTAKTFSKTGCSTILIRMSIGGKPEISLSIILAMPSPISRKRIRIFTRSTMPSKAKLIVWSKTFQTKLTQSKYPADCCLAQSWHGRSVRLFIRCERNFRTQLPAHLLKLFHPE